MRGAGNPHRSGIQGFKGVVPYHSGAWKREKEKGEIMLELRNISKYYNMGSVNEMCLFKEFSFEVEDNQFVSVVGSNGSGKTSLLNIIC